MSWRPFTRRPEPQLQPEADDELGDELDAFLEGRYVGWLTAAGLPIPVWARLNLVAHGAHAAIVRSVRLGGVPKEACCFRHAALVVEAVVVATIRAPELARVQRELLVPLELELMAAPVSPRGIVAYVLDELL